MIAGAAFNITTTGCIVAGYAGAPTMAVFDDRCTDGPVMLVDLDHKWITAWYVADWAQLPVHDLRVDAFVVKVVRGYMIEVESSILLVLERRGCGWEL